MRRLGQNPGDQHTLRRAVAVRAWGLGKGTTAASWAGPFSFAFFCLKSARCGYVKKKAEETGGFGEKNYIIHIFNC